MKRHIEAFKNELRNYQFYRHEIENLNRQIKEQEYKMGGVSAVDYSKQSGNSFNESAIEEKRLSMIEEYNEMLIEKRECEIMVVRIERRLRLMNDDERKRLIDVVVKKMNYREACKKYHFTNTSSLFVELNNTIKSSLPSWLKR